MNTPKALSKSQREFLSWMADHEGMRAFVNADNVATKRALEGRGLVVRGKAGALYLTREGYAALGRESEY